METSLFLVFKCSNLNVLILPMRNGNNELTSLIKNGYIGSYPTYEEWKPIDAKVIIAHLKSSYPTYEEWKPFYQTSLQKLEYSSYPTYEEWKQYYRINISCGNTVLILPMRNGNFST